MLFATVSYHRSSCPFGKFATIIIARCQVTGLSSFLPLLLQEQASWVCECDESLVMKLEQDFKTTLQQQQTLEQWAEWLKGVVSTILKPYEDGDKFPKAARKFLLKWSFYR